VTGRGPSGAGIMREPARLGLYTAVYGLGELVRARCQDGRSVDTGNADGGTHRSGVRERPVRLTIRPATACSERPGRCPSRSASVGILPAAVHVPGSRLEYLVIYCPSRRHPGATTRPDRAPARAARPVVRPLAATSFPTSYDEARSPASVTSCRAGAAAVGLPLRTAFWIREFPLVRLRVGPGNFPARRSCSSRLKARAAESASGSIPTSRAVGAGFEEGKARATSRRRSGPTCGLPPCGAWEWP